MKIFCNINEFYYLAILRRVNFIPHPDEIRYSSRPSHKLSKMAKNDIYNLS